MKPGQRVREVMEILADHQEWDVPSIVAAYRLAHPDDPTPYSRESSIRSALRQHCKENTQWRGRFAIFESPRRGVWVLATPAT
jgi:hypothetical protein